MPITVLDDKQLAEAIRQSDSGGFETLQVAFGTDPLSRQFTKDLVATASNLSAFKEGAEGLAPKDQANVFKSNILKALRAVDERAVDIWGEDASAKRTLAANTFVLAHYGAFSEQLPSFLWPQLGVFAANEVRYSLAKALGFAEYAGDGVVTDGLRKVTGTVIHYQKEVAADLGSLALLYQEHGAQKLQSAAFLSDEAKEGFRLQASADLAAAHGDLEGFRAYQTNAAVQFGYHEQRNVLQRMWDQPEMRALASINSILAIATDGLVDFMPADIHIGTNKLTDTGFNSRTIAAPYALYDLSDGPTRDGIALHAFHELNILRQTGIGSDIIQQGIYNLGQGINLYQPIVLPTRWPSGV